ncbi:MAG: hypothetical protein CVV64_12295 [Candidatus Wallbacteria bacterium HGW-Wallbacteria-1]|uniref:Uncharacterized protein n=1 Tax=Candidatus Wallbacteria bacterium HGW-Wallbacteria-1 TaxID=2013854 RepID=A0A2N1PNJ6_9BACT|nr:MAG: hypothetical protein CVV64_12295 [Candidatus Wallbacteria bacterium HGW-Wallbacteria-1]
MNSGPSVVESGKWEAKKNQEVRGQVTRARACHISPATDGRNPEGFDSRWPGRAQRWQLEDRR